MENEVIEEIAEVEDNESEIQGETNETVELEPKSDEEIEAEKAAKAQKAIDDRIAEKHRQYLEAEEERKKLKAELDRRDAEAAAKKREAEDSIKIPEFPSLPEFPTDEEIKEYHAQVLERDKIIREKSKIDAQRELDTKLQQEKAEREKEEANRNFEKDVDTYFKRAVSAGMDKSTAIAHGKNIHTFLNPAFTDSFILVHEKGPEIVKYLSENKDTEAKNFDGMSALQASAYIESKIVPKLPNLKTKKPSPETPIRGDSPIGAKSKRGKVTFY